MTSISTKKHQKTAPEARPTTGGKNIMKKYPDSKNQLASLVPMVIMPTENGTNHYPLVLCNYDQNECMSTWTYLSCALSHTMYCVHCVAVLFGYIPELLWYVCTDKTLTLL